MLVGVAAVLALLAGRLVAGAFGPPDPRWPDGVLNVYGPKDMTDTLVIAARRWSDSGAHVTIRVVLRPEDADAFVRVDDRRLATACGKCLGHSSSIGRPPAGHPEVLLHSKLRGQITPLSTWVAAHELGHVLGLRHTDASRCTLMSRRAFDSRCAPTLASTRPDKDDLVCIPGRADAQTAARMYGGVAARDDVRCG